MFISSLKMLQCKTMYKGTIAWAGALNLAVKTGTAQSFKLKRPVVLRVRQRAGAGGRFNWPFKGGEEFKLSRIVMEQELRSDGIALLAIFMPSDLLLCRDIATLTLPLADSIEFFEHFDSFVSNSMTPASQERLERESAHLVKLPTLEESHASEAWGSW